MDDGDLLKETFLKAGKKNHLDEDLLCSVFDFLIRNQRVSLGDREALRGQLERLIKKHLRDNK